MGGPSDSCSGTGKCPQKPSLAATTTAIHYLPLLLLPLLLTTRVPASRLIATRASRIPCDDVFQWQLLFFVLLFRFNKAGDVDNVLKDHWWDEGILEFFSICNVGKIVIMSLLVAGFHVFAFDRCCWCCKDWCPKVFNKDCISGIWLWARLY